MTEFYRPDQQRNQESFRSTEAISQNIERDIFIAELYEEPEQITISYKEWQEKNYIAEPGIIVTDVRPQDLFTTQDWLEPDKWIRAVEAQDKGTEDAFIGKGVIFKHPKHHMGIVPVLLEGNHRAVNALQNGYRVNFKIVDKELPEDAKVWRLTNLSNKYGGGLVR